MEGSFVIELDVAVVEADANDVSKRVVAQAKVLGVLVVILNLERMVVT